MHTIDTLEVLNREQLSDIAMGDGEVMREILGALIAETSGQLPLLAAAIAQRDSTGCKRLAHYSKGACSSVGASRAAWRLRQIEEAAVAGAFDRCGSALQALSEEISSLRDEAEAQNLEALSSK